MTSDDPYGYRELTPGGDGSVNPPASPRADQPDQMYQPTQQQPQYGAGYPPYAGGYQPGYQPGYPSYPSYPGSGYQPGGYAYGYPPVAGPPRRRNRRALIGGFTAGALAAALAFGAVEATRSTAPSIKGTGAVAQAPQVPRLPNFPNTVPGALGPGSKRTGSGTAASATESAGVVTVVSVLKYQNAESAGSGMVLTSDGEVLTNNHVVNGATRIVVTIASTGRSYHASVVGTAPSHDVALLKLAGASGLQTADLASSSAGVSVGDTVTGVGNAGGTGRLTQASGTVTGVDRTITASDETGADSERLHGLIQTDAGIISGDSGGPLYDSGGQVIGMDTAASSNTGRNTAYAIPIEDALSIVHQIQTGVETSSIHIGLPGFMGIGPSTAHGGVGVDTVLPGGPAARAGIRPGAVITSIDGTRVRSATALHNLLSAKGPGASVQVDWVDRSGQGHSASITLVTGPAD